MEAPDLFVADAQTANQIIVEYDTAPSGHGAHSKLGPLRHSQFADQAYIQRSL